MKKFHRIVKIIILLSGSKFLLAADGPAPSQVSQRLHERAVLRSIAPAEPGGPDSRPERCLRAVVHGHPPSVGVSARSMYRDIQ